MNNKFISNLTRYLISRAESDKIIEKGINYGDANENE